MVFIAKSLDGYIADSNDELDWLQIVPNPDKLDFGYEKFINRVDALVMGRVTFEIVCSFDCDWPYKIPVFVLSSSLDLISEEYKEKAEIVSGTLSEIIKKLNSKGYSQLYIDGGATIQSFLKEDLIDEIIVTTIPILLGGGTSLFGELPNNMEFEHVESILYLDAIVQNCYIRKR